MGEPVQRTRHRHRMPRHRMPQWVRMRALGRRARLVQRLVQPLVRRGRLGASRLGASWARGGTTTCTSSETAAPTGAA